MSTFYIKIYYGPIESLFTFTEYKPQHLTGLRFKLQQLGFRVDLVPVEYKDYCMICICGHLVFRCNIRSLRFNTPAELDPVCLNAVDAVVEAHEKLNRARCYLWIFVWIERQMFKRNEYSSKSYWICDLPPMPPELADINTCLSECCKILTTKVEDVEEFGVEAPPVVQVKAIDPIEAFCNDINKTYGNAPFDNLGDYQEEDINLLDFAGSKHAGARSTATIRSGLRSGFRSTHYSQKLALSQRNLEDKFKADSIPVPHPPSMVSTAPEGAEAVSIFSRGGDEKELFKQASDVFKEDD